MKTKFNLTLIIAAFWLLIVVGGYYLIHSPIPATMFLPVLFAIWTVLSVGMVVSLAGGIGFLVLRLEKFPGLVRVVIQAALGLGLMAMFVMLLGTVWRVNSYFLFFWCPSFWWYTTEVFWVGCGPGGCRCEIYG